MESNQQNQIAISKVLARPTQSVFYPQSLDSKNHQTSYSSYQSQTAQGNYDSTYRNGYPKLYSWNENIKTSRLLSASRADKSKFSFKQLEGSKVNQSLKQQNQNLRREINRLTVLLQSQRRSTKLSSFNIDRSQVERLTVIIQTKTSEIHTLEQRLTVIERQRSEWLYQFQESQRVIRELKTQIIYYSTQTTRLQQSIVYIQSQQQQRQPQKVIVQKIVEKDSEELQSLRKQIKQIKGQVTNQKTSKYEYQLQTLRKQVQTYQTEIRSLKSELNVKTSSQTTNYQLTQYKSQISQYKSQFSNYQRKLKQLQETNWKLEQSQKKSPTKNQLKPKIGQINQQFIEQRGKFTLRIIILLEQINRLKQRQIQLDQKAVQLHKYLLRAENYIEQVQAELQKNNLKQNIPVHIVQKITILEQQIESYKVQIRELNSRTVSKSNSNQIDIDTHTGLIGQRDLRIVILLQEIARLNEKVTEVRSYLQRAEDYIQQIQNSLSQKQFILPPEIQNQIGLLSQENNRLNEIIQNYINQFKTYEIRIRQLQSKSSSSQVRVQYSIPPEVQSKIAFLAQQNQRLTRRTQELQNTTARVQTKVQIKTEYIVPPQVQAQIAFLAQENVRLSQHISSLTISQKSQKVDFEKIAVELGKKDMRTIMLLQEINRLNFTVNQTRGYLIRAQQYIQQIERFRSEPNIPQQLLIQLDQLRQQIIILRGPSTSNNNNTQIETKIAFLAQQNERLSSIIRQMEIEIIGFRSKPSVDSSSYDSKIATLSQQNSRLTVIISGLQSNLKQLNARPVSNSSQVEAYQIQKGKLILKTIILLEEINRLNHVYLELRNHLIQAENYIEDVQKKLFAAQDQSIPTELQNQIAFLRQQHDRLTQYIQTIQIRHSQQINILNVKITNFSARPPEIKERQVVREVVKEVIKQVFKVPHQVQAKIAFLGQQNERLSALIQKLSTSSQSSSSSQISDLQIKIKELTERDGIFTRQNAQLKSFLGRAEQYIQQNESKWLQTQSISSLEQYQILVQQKTALWAQNQLRGIILLEQISRLNFKLSGLQSEHFEVIQHLKNAENYIRELQQKSLIQSTTSTIAHSTTNLEVKIQELTQKLSVIDTDYSIQVAKKSLQIIILLEQINRLNYRQSQLTKTISSSSSNLQVDSSSQIAILRTRKQQCQAQLTDVIQHLRNAQNFIEEISRDKVQIQNERAFLISELNRLQFQLQKRG